MLFAFFSATMSPTPLSARERLVRSHARLAGICDAIATFTPSQHVYHPPILDNHETRYTAQELPGLPKFRSICEKECAWLDELCRAAEPPEHPSTNAPYLVSVWEQVVRCPRPLVGISETFKSPRGERVKVDVIGKGGMLWVKVNTYVRFRSAGHALTPLVGSSSPAFCSSFVNKTRTSTRTTIPRMQKTQYTRLKAQPTPLPR